MDIQVETSVRLLGRGRGIHHAQFHRSPHRLQIQFPQIHRPIPQHGIPLDILKQHLVVNHLLGIQLQLQIQLVRHQEQSDILHQGILHGSRLHGIVQGILRRFLRRRHLVQVLQGSIHRLGNRVNQLVAVQHLRLQRNIRLQSLAHVKDLEQLLERTFDSELRTPHPEIGSLNIHIAPVHLGFQTVEPQRLREIGHNEHRPAEIHIGLRIPDGILQMRQIHMHRPFAQLGFRLSRTGINRIRLEIEQSIGPLGILGMRLQGGLGLGMRIEEKQGIGQLGKHFLELDVRRQQGNMPRILGRHRQGADPQGIHIRLYMFPVPQQLMNREIGAKVTVSLKLECGIGLGIEILSRIVQVNTIQTQSPLHLDLPVILVPDILQLEMPLQIGIQDPAHRHARLQGENLMQHRQIHLRVRGQAHHRIRQQMLHLARGQHIHIHRLEPENLQIGIGVLALAHIHKGIEVGRQRVYPIWHPRVMRRTVLDSNFQRSLRHLPLPVNPMQFAAQRDLPFGIHVALGQHGFRNHRKHILERGRPQAEAQIHRDAVLRRVHAEVAPGGETDIVHLHHRLVQMADQGIPVDIQIGLDAQRNLVNQKLVVLPEKHIVVAEIQLQARHRLGKAQASPQVRAFHPAIDPVGPIIEIDIGIVQNQGTYMDAPDYRRSGRIRHDRIRSHRIGIRPIHRIGKHRIRHQSCGIRPGHRSRHQQGIAFPGIALFENIVVRNPVLIRKQVHAGTVYRDIAHHDPLARQIRPKVRLDPAILETNQRIGLVETGILQGMGDHQAVLHIQRHAGVSGKKRQFHAAYLHFGVQIIAGNPFHHRRHLFRREDEINQKGHDARQQQD